MKKFARILCVLFIGIFAVLSTGCFFIGNDSSFHDELIKQYENGEITYEELQEALKDAMSVPMHGTKVLYRPEHYDYDGAVGEGNQEYYGQYAWQILSTLLETYAIANSQYVNNDTQLYYYDSVRYNLFSQNEYLEKYVQDDNGTFTREGDDKKYSLATDFDQYATISVNTVNAWNWTFGSKANPEGLIYEDTNIGLNLIENGTIVQNSYYFTDSGNEYYDYLPTHYTTNANTYTTSYLGASDQQTIADYSDYVKALEYVIYCITMDLTPAPVTTTLDANGVPQVSIQGFNDVDAALEFIKDVFDKIGTYVGISPSKYGKIKDYILNNIIGNNAITNDDVTVTKYKIFEYQDSGVTKTIYDPISTTTISVNRNYDKVVEQIISDVCEYVHIGSEADDTINNRYPASEIVDYYGNDFFLAADDEFAKIKPLEYQSAVLMFSEDVTVDNLILFFKYDAGQDGDTTVDPNASITINVYINYFEHSTNTYHEKLQAQTITVLDGEFDYGSDTSTLIFAGISESLTEGYEISAFNTEIGGGIMKAMEYDGCTSISEPLKLVGTTELKNYYKLVEPDPSTAAQNVYYSYGILNHEMFAGDGGCDYLEIAYEVVKTTGDYKTNYKFYTALGLVA